jgi:hypothetical protein
MEERRKDEITERISKLEWQVGRLVSDAESEKDTRRRVADAINARFIVSDERLRKLEHTIWGAAGAVAVVVLVINLIMKQL